MEATTTDHNSSLAPCILNITNSWGTGVICMLQSLVLGQTNAGTNFWGAEWAVAVIWTLAGKSLVAVYRQGDACPPPPISIILKIGHILLQKWQIIHQCEIHATDNISKVKVQCPLVQALRLCTGRTAHRGSRGIALPFMTTALEEVRGQRHAPAALYLRERPHTYCTEGWVGPRAGLDRCGKSRPTGIQSPDRPAHR